MGSNFTTLASGIDIGQGINVGPGKFGKKDKRAALEQQGYKTSRSRNLENI